MLDGGGRAPERLIDLALRALPRETDELNVQRILGVPRAGVLAVHAPDATAPALAPQRRTACCATGLDAATDAEPESRVVLRAARHRADTPRRSRGSTRVWRRSEKVAGADAGRDRLHRAGAGTGGARRAGRGRRSSSSRSSGRRIRTARRGCSSCVPALSADPAERDAFFASLDDVANRRREPWVLEALRYLHHPLRAAASEKYIEPSLELLQEIQRTGDIFFPKRWMDATLGGHRSAGRGADRARASSTRCRRTIRSGCAGSSCRRPTTSFRAARTQMTTCRTTFDLRDATDRTSRPVVGASAAARQLLRRFACAPLLHARRRLKPPMTTGSTM